MLTCIEASLLHESGTLSILFIMQHWSKVEHLTKEPSPAGRSGHAAVCLGYGGNCPQLLVIGGLEDSKVFEDVWLLNVASGHWREVSV